jgi:hypothetical protein
MSAGIVGGDLARLERIVVEPLLPGAEGIFGVQLRAYVR